MGGERLRKRQLSAYLHVDKSTGCQYTQSFLYYLPSILFMCSLVPFCELSTCLLLDRFPVLRCSRSLISPQGSLKFYLIHLSDHPSIQPSVCTSSQVRFYLCCTYHPVAAWCTMVIFQSLLFAFHPSLSITQSVHIFIVLVGLHQCKV